MGKCNYNCLHCFNASDYCVPKEILFPNTLEDQLYVKVRFALAEHAQELRNISRKNLNMGMIKKIWGEMKYILTIGGESFSYYTKKMLEYADGIPIHHYAYAASEGVFGIAEKMNIPGRYILFHEAVFFEFIPIKNPEKTLIISEINVGEKYEVVVTNRSGLYRYRLGGVIKVIGKFKKAPVVKYCYRRNQVINIAGEKSNQQQFDAAVKRFMALTDIEVQDAVPIAIALNVILEFVATAVNLFCLQTELTELAGSLDMLDTEILRTNPMNTSYY